MRKQIVMLLVAVAGFFTAANSEELEIPLMEMSSFNTNSVKGISIENGKTLVSVVLSDRTMEEKRELVLFLKDGQEFNPALEWEVSLDYEQEIICPEGAYKLSSCIIFKER